jgi:uncharacterized protein (DUF1697 family)
MPTHIAMLRAVNVGGTGKLPMADLREIASALGFQNPRTYIASGNLVLESQLGAAKVKQALEAALLKRFGKPCAVLVRSAAELQQVLEDNPFPKAEPSKLLVLFLDAAPDKKALAAVTAPDGEQVEAGAREVYIHFPNGMGRSKLKIPLASISTGRNLNTVRALLQMCGP